MNLVRRVVSVLESLATPYALIGGHAVSVRGFPRMTLDFDFLSVDPRVLSAECWKDLESEGARVDIRRGDADDPIAGLARITFGEDEIDILLARWKWEAAVLQRAERMNLGDVTAPVPITSDLILLKLAAGGPVDLQDVVALIHANPADVIEEVEAKVGEVRPDVSEVWTNLRRSLR